MSAITTTKGGGSDKVRSFPSLQPLLTHAVNLHSRENNLLTKQTMQRFTSLYLLFCSSSCSTKVESHSWHSNKAREEI